MTSIQGSISGKPTANSIDLRVASTPNGYTVENGFSKPRGPHKFGAIGDGIPSSKTEKNGKDNSITPRTALQAMDSNSNGTKMPLVAACKPLNFTQERRLGSLTDDTWEHPALPVLVNELGIGETLIDNRHIDVQRLNQANTRTVAVDNNVGTHAPRPGNDASSINLYPLEFKNPTQSWLNELVARDQRTSGIDALKAIVNPWSTGTEESAQCSEVTHKYLGASCVPADTGSGPLENILKHFPRYDTASRSANFLRDSTFAQNNLRSASSNGRNEHSGITIPNNSIRRINSAANNYLQQKYSRNDDVTAKINQLMLHERDIGHIYNSDHLDYASHNSPRHSPLAPPVGSHHTGAGPGTMSISVDSSTSRPQELDDFVFHCSPNYKGNPKLTGNQSASISHKDSCALWITNLNFPVAENAYHELLLAARGCGKVYACVINPPDGNKGHTTWAAKLVFFDKSGAHALLHRSATGEFIVNGYVPKVVYNRIRTASQPPGPESRVIHIDGPKRVVDKNVLKQFFAQRFNFQTDEVIVLSEEPGPEGRRRLEWRFGSYRCQASSAISTIQKQRGLLPPGIDGNFWGQVVTFFGVDPCAPQK